MVSAEEWVRKRNPVFKSPVSGDEYILEIPDPISLIQFWIQECKIKSPLDQKELGKKIMRNPDILAKMLIRYVKEPKLTYEATSKEAINVQDFMKDQVDCIGILTEVMSPFLTKTDELLNFFRDLKPSVDGGGNRDAGGKVANRTPGATVSKERKKAPVEPSNTERDIRISADQRRGKGAR